MAEEGQTQTQTTGQGTTQAAPAPAGTTAPAPTPAKGQSGQATAPQTTDKGTAQAEDSFFDPKDLDPALIPAYKQMQKAFTKKTQEIAQHRQKVEAYDAFNKDPIGQMQTMAARMGYKLTRAEAAVAAQNTPVPENWQPQTWGEVMEKFQQSIIPNLRQEVIKDLSPALQELQNLRKSNLERMLDDSCPDWRTYEDDMKANLQAHPSLVNDPAKLYRISVPEEVLESLATQRALKKLEAKAKSSQVGGTSTTTKHQSPGTENVRSFNDAVEYAKRRLAEQGIRPPGA
jgi:hypothetical protein